MFIEDKIEFGKITISYLIIFHGYEEKMLLTNRADTDVKLEII